MKTLLFILLFISINTFGQSISDIQINLKKKHFIGLQKLFDSTAKNGSIDWSISREIVDDNFETIIDITKIKPIDSNGSNVDSYTLKILSTKEEIFYYQFIKWIYVGDPLIIDSLTDSKKYQELERSFSRTYHISLDPGELFQNKIVYGSSCGIAGTPTQYQKKLDSLVRNRDSKTILSWLRSPNTEKQLYAIQGLRNLQRKGYKLNSENKDLIDFISKKKGKVYTCGGCLYTLQTISGIAEHLNDQYSKDVKKRSLFSIGLGSLLLLLALIFFYQKRMKKNTTSL